MRRLVLILGLTACHYHPPGSVDPGQSDVDGSVLPGDDAPAATCIDPLFTLQHGNSRYYIGLDLDWAGSKAECAQHGGRLAIIETADENAAISALLLSDSPNPWTWIGLEKLAGPQQWVDGAALGASDFQSFNTSTGDPNDDCYDMNGSLEKWGDWHCTDMHAYLCECDPQRP